MWVRSEDNTSKTVLASAIGQTGVILEEPLSQNYRDHLHTELKARMKSLCNIICPRNIDGVILHVRAKASLRRPVWYLDEIIKILREEFDEIKIKDGRDKALKYMAICACTFKRLRSISAEAWETMG